MVEPARILPEHRDRHVVQFGAPATLELNHLRGLYRKDGSSLFRLGDREPLGRLLDFKAKLLWNFVSHLVQSPTRGKIHPRDNRHHCDGENRKPATQASDSEGHVYY